MTRQRGFTLLEVVVAMGIMAFVFVAAQQIMSGQLNMFSRQQDHRQALEATQRTLMFLTLDMEQLVARPVRDSFGDFRPAVEGNDRNLFVTRLGWANPFDLRARSSMQRVGWELRDEKLVRTHMPVLDAGVGTEPVETVMLEAVTSAEFRYLERSEQGEYKWLEEWPPPARSGANPLTNPLPASIEVTVELDNGQSLHRYFRLVANPWQ